MNRSRLLMIGGLALAIGLLVSYTVYNKLRTSASATDNANGVPVVVAAGDIRGRHQVDSERRPRACASRFGGPSRSIFDRRKSHRPRRSFPGKQRRLYSAE